MNKDWKKVLIPLAVTAFLSITAAVYGYSIMPRIHRTEQGIDRLIELVMEIREDLAEIKAIKEDILEIKAVLREHSYAP